MGRAIAVAFGRAGASVVMGDVDQQGGRETERLVAQTGAACTFV
jgi:NAD(P)-dependent dehydrogenase (short-subunit alcohol dehydrogenase family)